MILHSNPVSLICVDQESCRPGQITNVSYLVADNQRVTAYNLSGDFEEKSKSIARSVYYKLLTSKFPEYRPRNFGRYGEIDKMKHDLFARVEMALIYMIDSALNNAMEAVFEKMAEIKFTGEIGLAAVIENGQFAATVTDNGFGIPQKEIEQLSLGGYFDSRKNGITEKVFQKGGDCRGIRKSAALVAAHGGIIDISTHNREGQKYKLTFGTSGMSENILYDLNLPIPLGIITAGSRLTQGTTYTVRFPIKK